MKHKKIILAVLASLAMVWAGPAAAQSRFQFKAGGGLAYIGGGDLNTGLEGWSDLLKGVFDMLGGSYSGGYEPVHLGLNFNGEVLYEFSPQWSIGLGVGYISASKSSEMPLAGTLSAFKETWSPKVGVIPITLNVHYTIPGGGALKFILHGGAGYYLADIKLTQHIFLELTIDDDYKMSAHGFGVHGGAGLEIAVSAHAAFTFDILGRYASLGPIKGDRAYRDNFDSETQTGGTFWFENLTFPGVGTYPVLAYNINQPSAPQISGVREAKLDLSGFSAQAGFVFRF